MLRKTAVRLGRCGQKALDDDRLDDMRFCKSLVVVLLGIGCAAAAKAQAGVYVGFQATSLRGIECFSPAPVACANGAAGGTYNGTTFTGEGTGSINPQGFQAGAYYDFKSIGPMRLGLDFRGGTMHSNKSATSSAGGSDTTVLDNALLGVRGSFHTRFSWLNPYVQMSAGYARSNATLPVEPDPGGGESAAADGGQLLHVRRVCWPPDPHLPDDRSAAG